MPVLDADGDRNYAGNPHVSHLINALLYGVLCAVLYLTLLEMLNPRRVPGELRGHFLAVAAALLFAAHPVHTEAVANIKGRDEILVLLGCLLAVLWTLRSVNRPDGTGRRMIFAATAFLVQEGVLPWIVK